MSEAAPAAGEAHHNDNQRRFMVIEEKVDANTLLTAQLARDTAGLLEMWKDAGVVFKWLRRLGGLIVWVRNVGLAALALYVAWKYGGAAK